MKVKYTTTIYSKKSPYGKEKTCIFEGQEVEKPRYLIGCENCIFLENDLGKISIIEKSKIIKVY